MQNWEERHKKLIAILDEDEGAFDDGDDDNQGENKEFYRLLKKGGDDDETEELIDGEYRDVLDGLDDIEDGLTEEFEKKIRDSDAITPEEVDELLKVDYYKIPKDIRDKLKDASTTTEDKQKIFDSIKSFKDSNKNILQLP